MVTILIIILLVVVLGGWGYNSGNWGPAGGVIGLLLVIILILYLTGNLAVR
jgi:hypothetical protein